jgi:hypothetical protein
MTPAGVGRMRKNRQELIRIFACALADDNHLRSLEFIENSLNSLRIRCDLFNKHSDDVHLAMGRGRSLIRTKYGFSGRAQESDRYGEFEYGAEEVADWVLERDVE